MERNKLFMVECLEVKQRKHHFAHMHMEESIRRGLADYLGFDSAAIQLRSIGGGSINHAFRVDDGRQEVFIKANHAHRYPGMFEAEAKGLDMLRRAGAFFVPEVYFAYAEGDWSMIAMEFIPTGAPKSGFSEEFAQALLSLHEQTNDHFGLDHDNYIGSLPQSNSPHGSWVDFFRLERVEPQLMRAIDGGLMDKESMKSLERIFNRLDVFFPPHMPALLHGDLWSGNYMVAASGGPVIMDPAVYYGHPLMDLGMMRLFGGFDPDIFDHYVRSRGWGSDWMAGAELANLYPLLVHVNLFGGGYVHQVQQLIQRFA